MQAPTLKLGGGHGPHGTLANVIVGHLHEPRWQGTEMLLHCRPRRHHHADGDDWCLVEGIETVAVFH